MKKNFAWFACCMFSLSLMVAHDADAASKSRGATARSSKAVFKEARASKTRPALAARSSRSQSGQSARGLLARGAAASAKVVLPVAATTRAIGNSFASGDANSTPILNSFFGGKKPLPQRMYAAEGDLFYFNGNKFRVEGVPEGLAKQELTKQRLQQLLDSGEVSIEPSGVDEGGLTRAVVRVAGRDIADSLR